MNRYHVFYIVNNTNVEHKELTQDELIALLQSGAAVHTLALIR